MIASLLAASLLFAIAGVFSYVLSRAFVPGRAAMPKFFYWMMAAKADDVAIRVRGLLTAVAAGILSLWFALLAVVVGLLEIAGLWDTVSSVVGAAAIVVLLVSWAILIWWYITTLRPQEAR